MLGTYPGCVFDGTSTGTKPFNSQLLVYCVYKLGFGIPNPISFATQKKGSERDKFLQSPEIQQLDKK